MGDGLWCPWCGSGNHKVNSGENPPWFICTTCGFEGPKATVIRSEVPPRELQEQYGLKRLAQRESQ